MNDKEKWTEVWFFEGKVKKMENESDDKILEILERMYKGEMVSHSELIKFLARDIRAKNILLQSIFQRLAILEKK